MVATDQPGYKFPRYKGPHYNSVPAYNSCLFQIPKFHATDVLFWSPNFMQQ